MYNGSRLIALNTNVPQNWSTTSSDHKTNGSPGNDITVALKISRAFIHRATRIVAHWMSESVDSSEQISMTKYPQIMTSSDYSITGSMVPRNVRSLDPYISQSQNSSLQNLQSLDC